MEIFPIIGLLILISSFLTQLLRIRRTQTVDGISPGAMWQLLVCCMLFFGYYLGNGHFIALLLNCTLIWITTQILIYYYKYRKFN